MNNHDTDIDSLFAKRNHSIQPLEQNSSELTANGAKDLATPFDKLNAAAARLAQTFDSLPSNADARRSAKSAAGTAKTPATAEQPKPARVGRFATLEDFVAGKKNVVSLNVAYSILDMPGQYSPLLFYGASGLGKTHLLQGIYTECVRRKIRAMYCTAEQFITEYMDALRNNTCSSNRAKFQKLRFLMLDNLDFLQGKVSTQRELHTIVSDLLANGAQVVFASTEHPRNLTGLEKSLQSLFDGGLISPLQQSEFETRLEIVRRMISARGINLPPESIRQIASQCSGNVREIIGVLNRLEISLIADPSFNAQSLTVLKVQEILDEWVRDTNFMVSLAKIEKTVCQAFDLHDTDQILQILIGVDFQQNRPRVAAALRQGQFAGIDFLQRFQRDAGTVGHIHIDRSAVCALEAGRNGFLYRRSGGVVIDLCLVRIHRYVHRHTAVYNRGIDDPVASLIADQVVGDAVRRFERRRGFKEGVYAGIPSGKGNDTVIIRRVSCSDSGPAGINEGLRL